MTEPTFPSSGNTIDLLLTSYEDRLGNVVACHPLPAHDHCPVLDYAFQGAMESNIDPVNQGYNWHKGDYYKLNKLNSQVDWDFELAYLNACKAFGKLSDIVNSHIKDCVPQRISHSRDKPPRRTNLPRGLIRHRHEAWLQYKCARQDQDCKSSVTLGAFSEFATINKSLQKFEVRCQADYNNIHIERFRENSKLLHSYV